MAGGRKRARVEPAVDDVLAALADPTRRQLLEIIARHGEATATVAAEELPVSRQAIVKHLAVLDRAGIVSARRSGREMLYTVRSQPVQAAAHWLATLASEWDARLEIIKRIAES